MTGKPFVLSVIVCFCGLCLGECPSADLNGDCIVNFLDFRIIASDRDSLGLEAMASQWLETHEEEADPLIILGRVKRKPPEPVSFEVRFEVVDKHRVDRSVFEYECRVILENISTTTLKNVRLAMASWSDNMTIIDPRVNFGSAQIAPGQSIAGIDTCTFRADRCEPINPVRITWHDLTALGDMVLVPEGTFQMGDNAGDGHSDEQPVHTVRVGSFFMGRYKITNDEYCDYLNSALSQGLIEVTNGVVYKRGPGSDYAYCSTSSAPEGSPYYGQHSQVDYSGGVFSVGTKAGRDMSNDPMVTVTWYGAAAYCNWRSGREGKEQCYNTSTWYCDFSRNGYRLATEAEWEYAARGGLVGRRFAWGYTVNHDYANYKANSSAYPYDSSPYTTYTFHSIWNDGVYPYISPVGVFPANGYGLYDMGGNVWDWCNDWYDSGYYDYSPPENPRGPAIGIFRVCRGGAWAGDTYACRVSCRGDDYFPTTAGFGIGFRIVLECRVPVVDDMEVYTPWTIPGNNIFETWRDGPGNCEPGNGNDTGAAVYENVDTAYVLAGLQSMKYEYDNDGWVFCPCTLVQVPRPYLYSKAEAQIADLASGIGGNWNLCGTTHLIVNFLGMVGNGVEAVDPLWVELKDGEGNRAKVVYGERPSEDPQHLTEDSWHEWVIELGDFAEGGVDTTDLRSIAIGVGREDAETPGASGALYFDEIRLATPQ